MNHEPQTFVDLQDTGNAQSQLLLQAVARHADWDTGVCRPRVAVLALMAKCSDKTARRHLAKLEADGFIVIEEREREDGGQGANKITLRGYAEWIKANRAGGHVASPRKARRYDRVPEGHQSPPGQNDQGSRQEGDQGPGQNDQGGALDNLTRGPVEVTRGPGHTGDQGHKNTFLEQDSPPNPQGGDSGQSVNLSGIAAEWLELVRDAGGPAAPLEHLLQPILERRRFSAADRRAELLALAKSAADLSPAQLRQAAEIVLAHDVTTIKPRRIADAIAAVRGAGEMFMARVGTPQHGAWLEHYAETNPNAARFAKTRDVQVPSEWPPAKSKRGAA